MVDGLQGVIFGVDSYHYFGFYYQGRRLQILMSFENQYIEKYGQRAIETYKRSLKHSDVVLEQRPSATKTQLKPKRSHSRKQLSNKSNKSLKNRQIPAKSIADYNNTSKNRANNVSGFHLSIHPNPQRKRLVIGEIGTPKATPNKTKRVNQGKQRGHTNVNVFVQTINRSKSKSKQSTPIKELKIQRSSKIKKNSGAVVADVIALLGGVESKNKNEKIGLAIEMLRSVEEQIHAENVFKCKLERKFQKIRELVGESQNTPGTENKIYHKDKLVEMESQIKRYRSKEQSLLKIIESLATKGFSKRDRRNPLQPSSQEQDDTSQC